MDAQQRFLHNVLRLRDAAEHAVGDRERNRPQLVKQPLTISHGATNPSRQLEGAGRHPSSRLALAFDAPRTSVIITTPASPATSRPINRRDPHRPLGTELLGQRRQPHGNRGGIIVDHVVGATIAVRNRRHGCLRRVGDMDERPHAATVPDQRELALADQLELLPPGRHRRARAVEDAVAQHDPIRPLRPQHSLLEVTHGGQGLAHLTRGRRVKRVLLALDRPAGARVRTVATDPLGHELPYPNRLSGGQEMIGRLGTQTVGQREIAIKVAHVDRTDRRQLMDDHLRARPRHGLGDLIGIKRVRDHRHSAQSGEHRLLRRAARHPVNLMTRGNQPRDQLRSNRSRRACHKHSHRQLLDQGHPAPIRRDSTHERVLADQNPTAARTRTTWMRPGSS